MTCSLRLLVVDRFMFWTEWGQSPCIGRARLNGSDQEVLVNSGIAWPNGISVDYKVCCPQHFAVGVLTQHFESHPAYLDPPLILKRHYTPTCYLLIMTWPRLIELTRLTHVYSQIAF